MNNNYTCALEYKDEWSILRAADGEFDKFVHGKNKNNQTILDIIKTLENDIENMLGKGNYLIRNFGINEYTYQGQKTPTTGYEGNDHKVIIIGHL